MVAYVVKRFSVVVLRDILGVDVGLAVDGIVDDEISIVGMDVVVVVGVTVVVVTLTDVLFAISFIGSQISLLVSFVSISLFTIPVLHSGTHMRNMSCVQMSNGRPFLVDAI